MRMSVKSSEKMNDAGANCFDLFRHTVLASPRPRRVFLCQDGNRIPPFWLVPPSNLRECQTIWLTTLYRCQMKISLIWLRCRAFICSPTLDRVEKVGR